MKNLIIHAVLSFSLCPLVFAQTENLASPTDTPSQSSVADRAQAIRNARTVSIHSETLFLTVSTLERSLMKQKNWDRLDLNIVNEGRGADLQIDVDRVHFTHIHTYVVTDKHTGIVLAAGRVRAIDGVVASGPMAEQIVKILSAPRLPAQAAVAGGE